MEGSRGWGLEGAFAEHFVQIERMVIVWCHSSETVAGQESVLKPPDSNSRAPGSVAGCGLFSPPGFGRYREGFLLTHPSYSDYCLP